jgi:hypothetical protein
MVMRKEPGTPSTEGYNVATSMTVDTAPTGELLMYETADGSARIECRFAEETLWTSQSLMVELFLKDVRTINEHLQDISEEVELDPVRTMRKFRTVRTEGGRWFHHC